MVLLVITTLNWMEFYIALRKNILDQVKQHRDKWEATTYFVLCSQHFELACFGLIPCSQYLGLNPFDMNSTLHMLQLNFNCPPTCYFEYPRMTGLN